MSFNKLVRDKIPKIIESEGRTCKYRVLSQEEYLIELKKKLQEEVNEFLESDNPEELADILEVLYALGSAVGSSEKEIDQIREKKAEKRGAFKDRIYLEE